MEEEISLKERAEMNQDMLVVKPTTTREITNVWLKKVK